MAIDANYSYPSPEEIASQRAYAAALMNQSNQPVHHWAEGLANVARALMGGYEGYSADQKQRTMQQGVADVYSKMLNGDPSSVASTPPMGNIPVQPKNIAPGKIYSNDEPSPLDPPSGQDRDLAIRTIVGEAGNQGPLGMQAVGNVIRNRAVNGGYGGDTPSGVVLAKNQFEPWNGGPAKAAMLALKPTDPAYIAASAALDKAYTGDDPTNGAVNFVAPKAQAALGRAMPDWAQGPGQDIGDHRFFGGVPATGAPGQALAFNGDPQNFPISAPAQPSSASAAAPPAAAPAPVASSPAGAGGPFSGMPEGYKQQLIRMLQNPQTAPMAQAIIQKAMESQIPTAPKVQLLKNMMGEDVPYEVTTGGGHVNMTPLAGGPNAPNSTAGMAAPDLAQTYEKQYPGVTNRVEQLYRGEGAMPNKRANPIDGPAMALIQQIHPDWDMTQWTAKNKMQMGLSSSQPSSMGGRLNALRNAFDHLANTSDSAVEKGNYDLGASVLSDPLNRIKSLTTAQRDIGSKLEREAVTYGGERTKFLTGSEGSEAERRAFLNSLGPDTAAPPQMAGTIEGEYTQLKSALLNQEQQVREQLGEDYLKKKPIITPDVRAALGRIEKNIQILRHGNSGAQSAQPATPTQSGPKVGDIQQGHRFKGGNPGDQANWEPIQ